MFRCATMFIKQESVKNVCSPRTLHANLYNSHSDKFECKAKCDCECECKCIPSLFIMRELLIIFSLNIQQCQRTCNELIDLQQHLSFAMQQLCTHIYIYLFSPFTISTSSSWWKNLFLSSSKMHSLSQRRHVDKKLWKWWKCILLSNPTIIANII